MHPSLRSIAHRPWPLPAPRWVMTQTWHDLLFAHWPVEIPLLRKLVPDTLPLDTFASQAWIGVVPFRMSGIRANGLPAFPGLSSFPELNVRTYVSLDGKPGVYFFSLDAASFTAVRAARTFYHLPYFHAGMSVENRGESVVYVSHRFHGDAQFRGHYRPNGAVQLQENGTLAHWLTERYCLYTTHGGRVFRAEIHHLPWPLQSAEAEIKTNTMARAAGISLPASVPMLHFARRLEVLIWPLRRVNSD
jgi:uncharacterized protein